MSAPASCRRLGHVRRRLPVGGHGLVLEADRDHDGQPGLLAAFDREQGFAQPREGLADDEVDPFLDLDRELLVEGLSHPIVGRGTPVLVHPGQGQVSGHEAPVASDFAGDAHGGAVELLEAVLEADGRELVAAGVERQRLQHVGARLAELDVQLPQRLGPRQRDLGRERARADPAAFLQFQKVSAVSQHRAFGQPFQDAFFLRHAFPLRSKFRRPLMCTPRALRLRIPILPESIDPSRNGPARMRRCRPSAPARPGAIPTPRGRPPARS